MTQEEQETLKEIQGSKGWQLMEFLIKKKVDELSSVMNLDERSETRAGIQALSQKKAVKLLTDFLNDLGFIKETKSSIRTHE